MVSMLSVTENRAAGTAGSTPPKRTGMTSSTGILGQIIQLEHVPV